MSERRDQVAVELLDRIIAVPRGEFMHEEDYLRWNQLDVQGRGWGVASLRDEIRRCRLRLEMDSDADRRWWLHERIGVCEAEIEAALGGPDWSVKLSDSSSRVATFAPPRRQSGAPASRRPTRGGRRGW